MTLRYLVPDGTYMADPAAHVFDGRLYIYPSHDVESGIPENDNGDHFDMRDYHVLSLDEPKDDEPALCPKIVRLSEDMLEFAEEPRDLVILDENGAPLGPAGRRTTASPSSRASGTCSTTTAGRREARRGFAASRWRNWSTCLTARSRRSRQSGSHQALGLIIPCIVSQLTKALNQPVLVVSLGYMPKPWPPCS